MSLAENQYLKRMLFMYQNYMWGFPIWPDPIRLTAPLEPMDFYLSVTDTSNKHFLVCEECILISDYKTFGVCGMTYVDQYEIGLWEQPADITWPTGTLIYPLFYALLGVKSELDSYTSDYSGMSIAVEGPIHSWSFQGGNQSGGGPS